MTEPRTAAGRALVRRLDRSYVAVYPASAPSYRDAILAIEAEAAAPAELDPGSQAEVNRDWEQAIGLDYETAYQRGWDAGYRHSPAAAPAGLDVERLERALRAVGRWRQHDPGNLGDRRAYADLLAAEYARLAAGITSEGEAFDHLPGPTVEYRKPGKDHEHVIRPDTGVTSEGEHAPVADSMSVKEGR